MFDIDPTHGEAFIYIGIAPYTAETDLTERREGGGAKRLQRNPMGREEPAHASALAVFDEQRIYTGNSQEIRTCARGRSKYMVMQYTETSRFPERRCSLTDFLKGSVAPAASPRRPRLRRGAHGARGNHVSPGNILYRCTLS